jgi:hypothetical protein
MPDPPIRFSPWTAWAAHTTLPNSHLPGVYLLAQFAGAPPRLVDPTAEDVIYIGEIYDNSLQSRWQQFQRAAFEGKPGHSGGLAYRDVFGDAGETLYVAAFVPGGLRRELRALYIRYVERKLVWEYARAWGGPPVCNRR